MPEEAPGVERPRHAAAPDDPAEPSPAPLQPVADDERIHLIDVLRGFALFGVLLANMFFLSGTDVAVTPARAASLPTAGVDVYARALIRFFVEHKANTIFAFLFGLGFAVQMMRAEERGRRIAPTYARRLLVLLVFGLAHMLLLWYGDILHLYAVVGFTLLFWRRRKDKTLVRWGLGFAIQPWAVLSFVPPAVMYLVGPPDAAEIEAERAAAWQAMEARLDVFTRGGYWDVMREHLTYNLGEYLLNPVLPLLVLYVMGRFLIGLYVGRRRLLHEAHLHLPLFRRLLRWGLALGLVGNSAFAITAYLVDLERLDETSFWWALAQALTAAGVPAMSCFYVSAIVLLYQRDDWRRRLLWLAPVGRMALTNYLAQTLLHLFIFYGFAGLGLMGRVGASLCVPVSLAIFALQILYSRWWLARFRFGPAEWLWRTLTYGRRQPMRQTV